MELTVKLAPFWHLFIENACTPFAFPSQNQTKLQIAFGSAASSSNVVLEVRTFGFWLLGRGIFSLVDYTSNLFDLAGIRGNRISGEGFLI
jgi:hypothetical protein